MVFTAESGGLTSGWSLLFSAAFVLLGGSLFGAILDWDRIKRGDGHEEKSKRCGEDVIGPKDPLKNPEELDRLSHQLKNPLNVILGYVRLLQQDDKLSDLHRSYLDSIEDKSCELLDRINLLLEAPGKVEKRDNGNSSRTLNKVNKVLIADDMALNRTLLKIILDKNGIESIEAENGKVAFEKIESENPDLVLMDIQMPVMDGIEAIRKIRNSSQYKNLLVIAVTAQRKKGTRNEYLDLGFDAYLPKPFQEEELLSLIRT